MAEQKKKSDETLYGDLLRTMVESVVQTIIGPQGKSIIDRVMPEIEARIKEQYGFLPELHEIKVNDQVHRVIGTLHEKYDSIVKMVQMSIPVYLMGKAGCGKNVICKQVAEGLGLDFYFTNAVTQEYKLTGFIDAMGQYQETQFYKAFVNGGLFFLDEMDASIPEVLIILNAAIANRYFDFPCGKKEAHKDFRVIAAGNTFGTGADNNYTGRYCLDRASLDRFAVVNIDYSPKVENAICNNNTALVNFCHRFREVTEDAGINCLFSYRTLERIFAMESILPLDEVLSIALIKEVDTDTLHMLHYKLEECPGMKDNKYCQALAKLDDGDDYKPSSPQKKPQPKRRNDDYSF